MMKQQIEDRCKHEEEFEMDRKGQTARGYGTQFGCIRETCDDAHKATAGTAPAAVSSKPHVKLVPLTEDDIESYHSRYL